jgi:hypothetical protein
MGANDNPSVAGLALQGGTLQNLPGNADLPTVISTLNSVISQLNNQLKTQVLADGVTKRFLSGYQLGGFPGGAFGMKMSLPGVDVTQATNLQLLFMWDFATGTMYWYDPTTHKNYGEIGILPNGVGGMAFMQPGFDVKDGIS